MIVGITHWAKARERVDYLDRTLESLRRSDMLGASLIVVSLELPHVSPFNPLACDVCRKWGAATTINPNKGNRVEANLDHLLDHCFSLTGLIDGTQPGVLYVQDDWIFTGTGIFSATAFDKLIELMSVNDVDLFRLVVGDDERQNLQGNLQVRNDDPFVAADFDTIHRDAVHFYSHNPAVHFPSLRAKVGRFSEIDPLPWEWKYNNACRRRADLRFAMTSQNWFRHIGDRQTIPPNEQDLGEDAFAIRPETLHAIRDRIPDGATLLEFGSGKGSAALANYYEVTCIEDQGDWLGKFPGIDYRHVPLIDGCYARDLVAQVLAEITPDVVLIDGPNSTRGDRSLVVPMLGVLRERPKLIVVDDTHRDKEHRMVTAIMLKLSGTRSVRVKAKDGSSADFITFD